jgi:pantoate--beta-alanine ligase
MIATGKIIEVRKILEAARLEGQAVGFVPTMGALHEGHRSLIRRARAENGFVVVSIFVNPTQFGANEDLSAYPRTFADDCEACADEGAELVFHPDVDEMYPKDATTTVNVGRVAEPMEGRFRPGHFDGVALVCAKLFAIVGPCTAYFGEKDAQQLRVVAQMVRDLALPVEVTGCPTVRDADGLALSSRNKYLGPGDRERSLSLSRALFKIESLVHGGERDAAKLRAAGMAILESAGLDAIDYLEVVDPTTLEAVDQVEHPVLVCGAVRIGTTRLIDNVTIRKLNQGGS